MSFSDNNFATKWRPKTFADVVGQDVTKTVLKKIALYPGIACRSIFLKGSYGSGKSTCARIFSRALNCEKFKELGDVCNSCSSCIEAQAQNSQTYMELDATIAGNVDAVRSLHDKLSYLPPKGQRRLVVFDEIHAASTAALNALLKLVEDGIPQTIFLFASTEDILPTLKSRSICLEVTTVPESLMSARVKEVAEKEGIKLSDSILSIICEKSQGHMRDALSYLQLYSFAGEEALKSPYNLLVEYIFVCLKHDRVKANELLQQICYFPSVDIVASIRTFLRNIYLADKDSNLYVLLQKGLANKLFSFFYSPVAQQAMKSEVGIELLLRSFLEKTNG